MRTAFSLVALAGAVHGYGVQTESLEPRAEFSYRISCEIFCNGEISDEMTGMASVSRTDGSFTNDYYFGIGGVKGYSELFFWMENPNYPAKASFGWELLSSVGSQWWMESRNPTYVFPCEANSWNDVELVQEKTTNMWTKTLTVNGEDRYRITSKEPNRGVLTGHSTIIGRTERSDQMRNLKIEKIVTITCSEQVEFTPLLGVAKNAYEAERRCRELGGHLAFFRCAADFQDYLAAVGDFSKNNWIGAQRVGTSNRFVNIDGSEAYLPWSSGEPNNVDKNENCVEVWRNGAGINDQNCNYGENKYSCRLDKSPTNPYGPIIKKAISWTEAVDECIKNGGTIAYIGNEHDLSHYKDAIGYKDFENMVRPRVWLGRRPSENPRSNTPFDHCLKYEPHTGNIRKEKCDQKMWFNCRY